MSGARDDSLLTGDIVDAVTRLIELGKRALPSADPDRDTAEMILWNLAVLGEATKRLQPATRARFGELDWRAMATTRDVVVHHYEGVDWEVIMQIIAEELPALLPRLIAIRSTLRAEFDAE
jgi:uncharacterized protein with HEPN domain